MGGPQRNTQDLPQAQHRPLILPFRFGSIVLVGFFLIGCATYQSKVAPGRDALKEGRFQEAIQFFEPLAARPGDDQLVYLLDLATAQQIAGLYKESVQTFLLADKLTEQADYHSVSNLALATVGSEEMVQYKGESFERTMINVMMAMSFLAQGDRENAMVQARRVNEKISKMRMEGGRSDIELNPFALYLAALLWEADGSFDNAYISLEQAYEVEPKNRYFQQELIRLSKKARRMDKHKGWREKFPDLVEAASVQEDRTYGELVLLVQQGWGPVKYPSPADRRIPQLQPVGSRSSVAEIRVSGSADGPPLLISRSQPVFDLTELATKTLTADYNWLVARRLGAFAAKEVLADQIRQKNRDLGNLAWLVMHLSERADLRQWSTLPNSFHLLRLRLKPGKYFISAQGLDSSGVATGDQMQTKEVQIRAGRMTLDSWRMLR